MPSMLVLAGALVAGSLSLTRVPALPHDAWFAATAALALVALIHPRFRVLGAFLAGASMSGLAAQQVLDDRLEASLAGRDLGLSVRIIGFPQWQSDVLRLTVAPQGRPELPARIRLSWIDPSLSPRIGETWRLAVRLRRPAGLSNPHGFDFEKWLFRERIGATGYVIGDKHNYRIQGADRRAIDAIRDRVVDRIDAVLADRQTAAVLTAIAVGARHRIEREQWDSFAATGTSHLMAISGLHIGLAAASAFLVARLLLAPMLEHRNARTPALACAAFVALVYGALSGLGLPAQRALIMLWLALILVVKRRPVSSLSLLSWTLLLVFLSDPLATLSPGFRLSFSAVFILLMSLIIDRPALRGFRYPVLGQIANVAVRLATMQTALLIGLYPLTVTEFDRVSIIAPVINLLVMPAFNLVIVPLVLFGVVFDGPFLPFGDRLISVAGDCLRWTLQLINTAGSVDAFALETASPVPWWLLVLGPITVVAPRGLPGRHIGFVCLLCALAFRPPAPPAGCVDLHTLDVGQGLAVVARTHTHVVLYDTGPAYRGGGGTVDLVVKPFLQSLGVQRLDKVIVSHDDLDHAGGIRRLLETTDVGEVIASTQGLAELTDVRCVAGLGWRSAGVAFSVLHPKAESPWTGNNASCVLAISTGEKTILLPGDIEKPVEQLMTHRRELPKSEVVVVPHHGSRTSSSDDLVAATRPAIAIVSAGWRNRWGFPKPDVLRRWQQADTRVLNTATDGAVSMRLCEDGRRMLERNREQHRRYWHEERRSPF